MAHTDIHKEIQDASRAAKIATRNARIDMTPEQRADLRKSERKMRASRRKGIGEYDLEKKTRILTEKEKLDKKDAIKAALKRRKDRLAEQRAQRAQRKVEKAEMVDIRDPDLDPYLDDFMAAQTREAKGGQVKKYGYQGGGKVYGQPRKAKYTAG